MMSTKKSVNNVWYPYRQYCNMPNIEVKFAKKNAIYLSDKISNIVRINNKAEFKNLQKWIKKSNGKILLDGISSWWSMAHGYNNKKIVSAIARQLKILPHIMFSGFIHKPSQLLCSKLCNFMNFEDAKVFLADSGSVANEVAIKICYQYYKNIEINGRKNILSFYNNYHGDTVAAMSVSACEGFSGIFDDLKISSLKASLPQSDEDFDNFDKFLQNNHQTICGVMIEPLIQGAAGMFVYSPQNLSKLCAIIKKYDLLLVFDECATGFYRTGKKFAFNHINITPDIVTLSKALTGGHIGLGACVVSENLAKTFADEKSFMHGPTFMANPLSCVAAIASIELFEKNKNKYLKNIKQMQNIFADLEVLKSLDSVIDVRIFGAMACVEIKNIVDIANLRQQFVKRCIWIRPIYTNNQTITIYLMPSFIFSLRHIKCLTDGIIDVVKNYVNLSRPL